MTSNPRFLPKKNDLGGVLPQHSEKLISQLVTKMLEYSASKVAFDDTEEEGEYNRLEALLK